MTSQFILEGRQLYIKTLSAIDFLSLDLKAQNLNEQLSDKGIDSLDASFWAVLAMNTLFENDSPAFKDEFEILNTLSYEQLRGFWEAYTQLEALQKGSLITYAENEEDNEAFSDSINLFKNTSFKKEVYENQISARQISDIIEQEALRGYSKNGGASDEL